MRELLYSVAGSFLASILLLAAPPLSGYLLRKEVCLDVETRSEAYGSMTISHIIARNSSAYGFSPLRVLLESDGVILRVAIRNSGNSVLLTPVPADPVDTIIAIGAGEAAEIIAIIERGRVTTELQRMFWGEYTTIGDRGLPVKQVACVRSQSDAQLSRYFLFAKIGGGFVVLVTLGTVMLLVRKKVKRGRATIAPRVAGGVESGGPKTPNTPA